MKKLTFLVPILIIWILFFLSHRLDIIPYSWMLNPVDPKWWQIFTAPLLHGSLSHILSNTLYSVFWLFLLYRYHKTNFWLIMLVGWVLPSIGVLLITHTGYPHLGFSGVAFFLYTYLITYGVFSKEFKHRLVGVLVLVASPSLLTGIFPLNQGVSWQYHLCGALIGVILAIYHKFQTKGQI